MDGTTGKSDGTSTHIWLRYATQFTVGERTHTIEMGVPVPIGASAEIRERLFREAETGMDQLARHVENRVAQVQRRSTSASQSITSPPKPPVQPVPVANKSSSSPMPAPTAASSPAASSQAPAREGAGPTPERKDVTVPPTRLNVGASMPSLPGDTSESLKLPQFIQAIKDTLGLTPKQAMDLLNVKTLSGLNLREALEQLRQAIAQEAPSDQQSGVAAGQGEPKANAHESSSTSQVDRSASSPAASVLVSNLKVPGIKEITHAVVREIPPAPAFDEEIDLDLDEEEMEYLPELTDQERAVAEHILSKLKEARGASAASETRLKVLNNVINEQISDEQLHQLIEGVWGVTALKKLKNDQVEALISWAKAADDFISEAETVLAVIQEDQYARSDR